MNEIFMKTIDLSQLPHFHHKQIKVIEFLHLELQFPFLLFILISFYIFLLNHRDSIDFIDFIGNFDFKSFHRNLKSF